MPVYNFGNQFTFDPTQFRSSIPLGGVAELNPDLTPLPSQTYSTDIEPVIPIDWEKGSVEPVEIREFLLPGFRYLDEGMKLYWSDLRVPTRDSVRFVRVRVAGGNKSLQVWKDDLNHGRVQLPVLSINRGSHKYNPEKFSPPYGPIATKFANKERTKIIQYFRPTPWLVDYTFTLWAETKTDAEYTLYQILQRFNPLAEFIANDGHVSGTVVMKLDGSSDISDKEAGAEQLAKIRYEMTITTEAWLSLPEKVVPSILSIYGDYRLAGESIPFNRVQAPLL